MKVTPAKTESVIVAKTTDKKSAANTFQWWKAKSDHALAEELLATAAYLKEAQAYRQRQTAIYARLYGNHTLFNFIGQNMSKMDQTQGLPGDRPTFNIISSSIDTLVSKIGQNRPSPVFLTDGSDYKQRNMAKKLNNFLAGEFYHTKAYEKMSEILRDSLVTGTGCLKVYETDDKRVGLERVLLTELFTDANESIYGEPRQLYQVKLIDRAVLAEANPKYRSTINKAEQAFIDNSSEASKSVSDLVMVVEGWRLPSGKDSGDGRHSIVCSAGVIYDEEYTKDKFPFVFLHYSKRLLGFWAQGIAERLMGTQLEINSLLFTISRAIKLVGVPRVFVEQGSKVNKAAMNNDVGVVVTYSGTKPIYEVAPAVPQEMYAQLQRLINYGYQQEGISSLDAQAQKPAGLNSGEAIRSYDDISTDRMAAFSRKYDDAFVELAYHIIDTAKEICEREGSYTTVYPNKDGTKQIDLPEADLIEDKYVIQCFNMSSLPRDPAGRQAKIVEMIQAGMISIKEGRRLLDFPDLEQIEKLANASEERIFQILDEIIESGNYTPPDPFMDLQLANDLAVQYYNLYSSAKLEEEKAELIRTFFSQVQMLKKAAMPQQPPAMPPGAAPNPPQANAAPLPTSPLVPNAVQ